MKALFVDGPEISDWGIADVKTLTLPVGEIAPLFRTGGRGLTRVYTASDYALDLRGGDQAADAPSSDKYRIGTRTFSRNRSRPAHARRN